MAYDALLHFVSHVLLENVTFNLASYGRYSFYFYYYYYYYSWGLQSIWLDCYYLPINNQGYRYLYVCSSWNGHFLCEFITQLHMNSLKIG